METRSAGSPASPASTRRRRLINTLAVIIGLLLLASFAWYLLHRGTGSASFAGRGRHGPPTTVGVATASAADLPVTIEALGTVTPAAIVTVRPQVSGVIQSIAFREGQMVRKGELLAQIDPRPFANALAQAQGALSRDQAQLADAKLQLNRYQTLIAQDSIAQQDVDTQAATVKQLEGTLAADRAAVGSAQLDLDYSRITAPVAGRVGLRVIDAGNYIGAGDAGGIVVITQVTPIDVVFNVPQDRVAEIRTRADQGTLPAVALDRTRQITLASGSFLTLDNQVDTTTGTVRAKARFTNADGALFPSQFVNLRVQLRTIAGAIVVPLSAVRNGSSGDFVYLINDDHTVSVRAVTRGQQSDDRVQILKGLKLGERVVTEGGDRLTDGATVQLPGDAAAAPTTPATAAAGQAPTAGKGKWPAGGRRRHHKSDSDSASPAGDAPPPPGP
ncbi:MdtA/MuxA family multidrug efflux RND transporter periplasmic adaptor subunit [Solimonas terrae]|uniref:MdtA/MuxA family multidrug efflux RND transporter periplasmic adaptor subunit n=1 Tax=Solimonas terrae TaxID=1396819 RepID=A0A6M2BX31_9GAMM|nr:MdtA/MuxA family multidrug efflux RND transporter periplasmic adaptor subunit [Solimonas terrae]NGY06703.1 MdtA/MuxA family multidrug efflux RND transporter periplasmic adaptor subunit [Solimonas terrae]